MKEQLMNVFELLKDTYKKWSSDDPFGKAAAVSYYAVFALPGLLLIIVTLINVFYDDSTTSNQITETLSSMVGMDSALKISSIIDTIQKEDQSTISTLIGIGSLLFGATGLFIQLQKSLNSLWQVEKRSDAGILTLLKDRATSLGVIIIIGFLLLLSLILSTVISILSDWISYNFGEELYNVATILNFIISLGIFTLLFASIYKILPDVEIRWRMVWLGAFVTSCLFTIGQNLISFYLSHSNPASSFGAGSAIILFLLWISYSCLILFFGASFTQVFGRKYGYQIKASKNAQRSADYRLNRMNDKDDSE